MNMFKSNKGSTAPTPVVPPRPSKEDLDHPITHRQEAASQENLSEVRTELNAKTKRTGVMGVMQKVNPFKSSSQAPSSVSKAPSSESLERGTDSTQNPGMLRGAIQKVNPFKSSPQVSKAPSSESLEQRKSSDSNQNPGMFKGVMQKVNPFKSSQPKDPQPLDSDLSSSSGSLSDNNNMTEKQKPGVFKGMMQKVNLFRSYTQMPDEECETDSSSLKQQEIKTIQREASTSLESLDDNPLETPVSQMNPPHNADPPEIGKELQGKQTPGVMAGMMQKVNPFKSSRPVHSDLSSSDQSLAENNNVPEKQNPGVFRGMMQKVNPFKSHTQMPDEDCEPASSVPSSFKKQEKGENKTIQSSSESLEDSTIERQSTWYVASEDSNEVKSRPTEAPKKRTKTFRIKRILPSALFGSGTKDSTAAPSNTPQETVEFQTLEMVEMPGPGEGPDQDQDPLDDEEGLLAWWKTVEGWNEWNEASQDKDEEEVVEQAADRVFMAARLFVRFFNQRGASLQQRILDLLSLADAADSFHKKTVMGSVGGGVASVAGSVTTITGLILAPFTAGTSLIVTAVGIGVATAGGLASASANITDTVHSKTDRKKVEQMINDYQEEMKDIRECLEFVQEGMETLEEWDFEKYAESISKKHLNQNVKHVMKEGGRAGKALVINTESLINTVQVLSVAGGAAKAAQVMSVTTGVMSGLFLALDVFFLAKDSVELKKGAKTEFAAKIREVCKELQDGLLELNRIKEELQKTMDGIEVEVDEEEEDEEQLKMDLKKLIELE